MIHGRVFDAGLPLALATDAGMEEGCEGPGGHCFGIGLNDLDDAAE